MSALTACFGGSSPPASSTVSPNTAVPSTPVPRTTVIDYRPEPAKVTARRPGYCWVGSLSSERLDAWRCMSDSYILDPCFSAEPDATASTVFCPRIDGSLEQIDLTQPLPQRPGSPRASASSPRPFLVWLPSGAACAYITGSSGVIGNDRMNYRCQDDSWLVGGLSEGPTWTAHLLSGTAAQKFTDCEAAARPGFGTFPVPTITPSQADALRACQTEATRGLQTVNLDRVMR